MKIKALLEAELEQSGRTTERLLGLVDDSMLNWKPESGDNWMTIAQLLHHLANGCGAGFKGFITGDWGFPVEEMSMEDILPPAEKCPAVASHKEAMEIYKKDHELAVNLLAELSDDRLETEPAPAPWDPSSMVLGQRLLSMIGHRKSHHAQLYYYLKLMGKPVNTTHLWGMGGK